MIKNIFMLFKKFLVLFFIITPLFIGISCTHLKSFLTLSSSKIGVIVPAGGARSFAAVGLFQVLSDYNIPVHYLIGMGWGAWLTASYAKNQNVDEVKWSVHKLRKKGYFDVRKNLVTHSFSNTIRENLISSKPAIPFACPTIDSSGEVSWNEGLNFITHLKICLSHPSFFKINPPTSSKDSILLASSIKESVEFLKSKGMGTILVLNPFSKNSPTDLKNPMEFLVWLELLKSLQSLKDSRVIFITPQLKKIGLKDFDKMIQIISAGSEATLPIVKNLQGRHKIFDPKVSSYQNKKKKSWKIL